MKSTDAVGGGVGWGAGPTGPTEDQVPLRMSSFIPSQSWESNIFLPLLQKWRTRQLREAKQLPRATQGVSDKSTPISGSCRRDPSIHGDDSKQSPRPAFGGSIPALGQPGANAHLLKGRPGSEGKAGHTPAGSPPSPFWSRPFRLTAQPLPGHYQK